MAPRLCTCQVTQFLCCTLRTGVITMSVLAFINACLAFAGEAALFAGMLSAVAERAAGSYLPAGSTISSSDKSVHGGLIFLGLYSLCIFVFGVLAAVYRRVWASTAFLVMMACDTFLGIFIAVVLWLAGGTFSSLVAQVPIFVINVYMVIVAASFRTQCKAWAAGDDGSGGVGLPSGGASGIEADVGVTDTTDISGAGPRKGATQATAAGTGAAAVAVDDGDDSDGDLGTGSRRGGRV